jgi:hypothetical protein
MRARVRSSYARIGRNRLNLRRFSNTKCPTKNFGFSCRRKALLANNLQRFSKFLDFQGLDYSTDTGYLSHVRNKSRTQRKPERFLS